MTTALLALVPFVLGGCGLIGGGGWSTGRSLGCGDISGGACQEQLDKLAARHPGATSIEIVCAVAVCDRKGGAGTAVVMLANGTTVNDTFAYVGDPAPLPVPLCTGLAPDVCRSLAASAADNAPPSERIAAIAISCTALPCTAQKGEADVTITFADGSQSQTDSGWQGGPP